MNFDTITNEATPGYGDLLTASDWESVTNYNYYTDGACAAFDAWRLETGAYDNLIIERDGTVLIEYWDIKRGLKKRIPVTLPFTNEYLHVGYITNIIDLRQDPESDSTKYRLKHR